MRRDQYERTYGRRSHMPPPMSQPSEDCRSRKSRIKVKCLISIGLILPALAAVIGVAAWAVSADVVMNSVSNNRVNHADNGLLKSFSNEDERNKQTKNKEEKKQLVQQNHAPSSSTNQSTTTRAATAPTSTTSTTSTTPSPIDEADVNAILSKLISASGAATNGNGPRFVVVAPLPDTSEVFSSPSPVSRVDQVKPQNSWQSVHHDNQRLEADNPGDDLMTSGSSQTFHHLPPRAPHRNSTHRNRFLQQDSTSGRRIGDNPIVINLGSNANANHRHGTFNSRPLELSGFEPFDKLLMPESNKPVQSFVSPQLKRPPPQMFFNSQQIPNRHFEAGDQHSLFTNQRGYKSRAPPSLRVPSNIGLKPIQQMHRLENAPLKPEESSRWGTIGYHGSQSGGYIHKPSEGISLSISSPANSGTHVSAEPVSVIKSFFLPFLPKPRLNMNARVVFGVVLDKGMGFGGNKKDAGHLKYH